MVKPLGRSVAHIPAPAHRAIFKAGRCTIEGWTGRRFECRARRRWRGRNMGLWWWRRDDSCGSAVIVVVRKRGGVIAHFWTSTAITRFGGLEIVVLLSSARIGMTTVMAKLIERMHSPREVVIAVVLVFMQPAYVRIVFVTWRPGPSKSGMRRRKIWSEVSRWRWRRPRREGVRSRIRQLALKRVVCKRGTFATLPLPSTLWAEFGTTPTGDMSTAVLDIHRGFAAVAALPRFPLRRLFDDEQGGVIIGGALGLVMPPAVTRRANLGPTTATPTLPAPAFRAHLLKLQQLTASPRRAGPVTPASVLLELLIPLIFKGGIKQLVNRLSRDVILGAAPRWHVVLRIGEW
jgi:hypothetical protein